MIEVQGKPVRGIIKDVMFNRQNGECVAVLVSEDYLAGTPGRHYLEQGRSMHTSKVTGFDVIDGQLIVITRKSAYIIEGEIKIWEAFLEDIATKAEENEVTPIDEDS